MKKIIIFILLLLLPFSVSAKEVEIYLFYGNECSYCHSEIKYLDIVKKQYGENIKIHKYEVWHNKKNALLMQNIKSKLNIESDGVPFTVIGDEGIIGFNEQRSVKISKMIDENLVLQTPNLVDNISKQEINNDKVIKNKKLIFPIGGEINVKSKSLIKQTLLLSVSTLFSLNSLWILLFMSVLILFFKEKPTIISFTFLLGVAATYLLLIFEFIKLNNVSVIILKTIISIIPMIMAVMILNKYIKQTEKNIKLKNKIFITFIFGILIGFIFSNYVQGVPNLLGISMQINSVDNKMYYLLYIIVYIMLMLLISIGLNKILCRFSKKNILSIIILFFISFILIFFPSIFLFTS